MVEFTWNEKGIEFIEKLAKDHERIARKVDLFTVSGAAFHNDPYGMSMAISMPRMPEIPRPPEPDWLRVIVKWVGGSDGSASAYATWTYDLYWPHDTEYENKLTDSPVEPENSRARYMEGKVEKAADGSMATAYRASDGTIKLYDVSEKRKKGSCS